MMSMKSRLKRFHKDVRGAVVVFVTLLLIPAILISGTGVDLARAYAAKSILHDANQLASNSALASYDALLHDLYGLYGIMSEDAELAELINQYIEAAIFPEEAETGLGTFQLVYGSNLTSSGVTAREGGNLANPEVLRRQIEEYAKFRAPAIIVEEIWSRLQSFGKAKADAEAIKEKMEIDDKVDEIDALYRKIYNCIQEINDAGAMEAEAELKINEYYGRIREQARMARDARTDYTDARKDGDEDAAAEAKMKYEGHIANIRSLVKGGDFRSGWMYNRSDPSMSPWTLREHEDGLEKHLKDARDALRKKIEKLNELAELCRQADAKKSELSAKLASLEGKLNSGECSQQFVDGMKSPTVPVRNADGTTSNKSILDVYRDLLSYNVAAMGEAVQKHDVPQINQALKWLDPNAADDMGYPYIYYGRQSLGWDCVFSMNRLEGFKADTILVDVEYNNLMTTTGNYEDDVLERMLSFEPDSFHLPENPYLKFQDHAFDSTKNAEFYAMLERLYNGESQTKKKSDNIKKGLNNLIGRFQYMYKGLLEYKPEGARKYENGRDDSAGSLETDFGASRNAEDIKKGLDDSLLAKLGNAFSNAGNKILLLTYDSEMFSCYATGKGEGGQEVSMSGIPLGIDVNYYYQSEMEYLYHGDETCAIKNLQSVAGMILLVRFVMNYIASFAIPKVNDIVYKIEEALAALGPIAIVVGELARVTLAFGESAMDVGRLKEGCKVDLIKTNENWRLALSVEELVDTATGTVRTLSDDDIRSYQDNRDNDAAGLIYKDYMRLFLLLKDGDVLAKRTAWLIGMNMTNKKEGIGGEGDHEAREAAMLEAEKFDMAKAVTDFSMTTTIDLRMLFLSMPFAQRGVNGVVPPGSLQISATDYRGY